MNKSTAQNKRQSQTSQEQADDINWFLTQIDTEADKLQEDEVDEEVLRAIKNHEAR